MCIRDSNTGELLKDLTPELKSLGIGEFFCIDERDVALVSTLRDGSISNIELNSVELDERDFIPEETVVRLAGPTATGCLELEHFFAFRGFSQDYRATDLVFSDDIRTTFDFGYSVSNLEAPL